MQGNWNESHSVKNSRAERMEWADKKGRIDMMDNGNWSEQYSMENIMGYEYNMDNGYVEVYYLDGNVLRLKCEEIEASLHTTEQSLAKLHKLLDSKPIEYIAMALSGELQAYCDIEANMVKGMFGTIVQGYLKQGYNKAMAEALAREFFRYES